MNSHFDIFKILDRDFIWVFLSANTQLLLSFQDRSPDLIFFLFFLKIFGIKNMVLICLDEENFLDFI